VIDTTEEETVQSNLERLDIWTGNEQMSSAWKTGNMHLEKNII
jgi:hypothetical protein